MGFPSTRTKASSVSPETSPTENAKSIDACIHILNDGETVLKRQIGKRHLKGTPPTGTKTLSVSPDMTPTKNDKSIGAVLHLLNDNEKEVAARSSYHYLMCTCNGFKSEENRDRYAKAMIERYIRTEQKLHQNRSCDEWEVAALTKLRSTLKFRVDNNIDEIRLCFERENIPCRYQQREPSDEMKLFSHLRDGLTERFSNGASVVRGHSRDGHAIFQNFPRKDTSWDDEFYIKGNIYTLERAIASTERRTQGKKDKVIVMYDYNGYTKKNTPPIRLVKKIFTILRKHFPERLEHVYIVDAPIIFMAFWAVIKHFIDPITSKLVSLVACIEFSLSFIMLFLLHCLNLLIPCVLMHHLDSVCYGRRIKKTNFG